MDVEGRVEGNVTVARRWFEELWSWPALDVADENVDAGYAPDWIQIPRTGPEQVKHEIRYFRSAFPDVAHEVVDTAAQGDRVWVRYRARGTQLGEAWGFPASGKTAEFEGVAIFDFNDVRRIVDRWGAFCPYDLFADLGLVPPFWEFSERIGD